jgi:hypothetical protein
MLMMGVRKIQSTDCPGANSGSSSARATTKDVLRTIDTEMARPKRNVCRKT